MNILRKIQIKICSTMNSKCFLNNLDLHDVLKLHIQQLVNISAVKYMLYTRAIIYKLIIKHFESLLDCEKCYLCIKT